MSNTETLFENLINMHVRVNRSSASVRDLERQRDEIIERLKNSPTDHIPHYTALDALYEVKKQLKKMRDVTDNEKEKFHALRNNVIELLTGLENMEFKVSIPIKNTVMPEAEIYNVKLTSNVVGDQKLVITQIA